MLNTGDAQPASDSSKVIGLSLAIGSGQFSLLFFSLPVFYSFYPFFSSSSALRQFQDFIFNFDTFNTDCSCRSVFSDLQRLRGSC